MLRLNGFVACGGGGQNWPVGVYGATPWVAGPAPFTPEETGLRLSPGIFVGGVSRLPTLTIAGVVCVTLAPEYGMYFCGIAGGGGNSKLGRLDAADLRAVRLEEVPVESAVALMADCWPAATAAARNLLSRLSPGGLKTSDSVVGGVGSVLETGMPMAGTDAVAPGQY